MKNTQNLIGGLVGAVALNILHQTVAHFDSEAPRVDLVGEEAITKFSRKAGLEPPNGNRLFYSTLAGDILGNGFFYSLAGLAKTKNLLLTGSALGLSAGIGALVLTEPLGLNDRPVTKTTETKLLTVAWYVFGGLVAGAAIRLLRKNYGK